MRRQDERDMRLLPQNGVGKSREYPLYSRNEPRLLSGPRSPRSRASNEVARACGAEMYGTRWRRQSTRIGAEIGPGIPRPCQGIRRSGERSRAWADSGGCHSAAPSRVDSTGSPPTNGVGGDGLQGDPEGAQVQAVDRSVAVDVAEQAENRVGRRIAGRDEVAPAMSVGIAVQSPVRAADLCGQDCQRTAAVGKGVVVHSAAGEGLPHERADPRDVNKGIERDDGAVALP